MKKIFNDQYKTKIIYISDYLKKQPQYRKKY